MVMVLSLIGAFGWHVFAGCDGLNGFDVLGSGGEGGCGDEGDVIHYTVNNGMVTITRISGFYGKEVIIPTNGLPVVSIAPLAFAGSGVTRVVIPDTLTNVGDRAFYNCPNLTNVTMGNGVISIGPEAFYFCPNLTNFIFPNNLTSIGDLAFSGCVSLPSVTVPNAVTNIGDLAFANCH
jgi:hypothetical protein